MGAPYITLRELTVKVEVEVNAHRTNQQIRVVEIPADKIPPNAAPTPELLDTVLGLVFHYGQNDFQPRPCPSVSVGDVIRFGERRYRVDPVGFTRVS
jgi:hypothetical protein